MALTKGEMVIVAGHLVSKIGEALDDPTTPDKLTIEEALSIFTPTLNEILKEYAD